MDSRVRVGALTLVGCYLFAYSSATEPNCDPNNWLLFV
ncbi:hypothetical protein GLYMA_19G246750v4 [Glycine max]|nr:hypothetical protein GLYMA_19G246750v4 [Glycine max]KAH1079432.1 hypothetical protein GYH30_054132 [Glycine max]